MEGMGTEVRVLGNVLENNIFLFERAPSILAESLATSTDSNKGMYFPDGTAQGNPLSKGKLRLCKPDWSRYHLRWPHPTWTSLSHRRPQLLLRVLITVSLTACRMLFPKSASQEE